MIPASYLYKDLYRQAWIEPTVPAASHHHIVSGLLSPLLAWPAPWRRHHRDTALNCAEPTRL